MVNYLVERATNDLLVGPDWAKNAEISHILVHDPGQVKDVIRGIKRRIRNKNPKVQILALSLLETLMNNCGDFVHMHVAEGSILQKMTKTAKKKRNYHVRQKILSLIDTWQEAFGGPGARYPQYHAAFYSLLRDGAIFPRRPDRRAPIFTAVQPHNGSSPSNVPNPDHQQEASELSEDAEFPTLSLSEIQNARGIIDVLAEMLNGLDPGNKEGVRQDTIVDLVQQCRIYKQRVVHLANSTSDESMLSQGLALNDDLQRLLAKHEAIVSGTAVEVENPKPAGALIDIDDPIVTNEDHNKQPNEKTLADDGSSSTKADPVMDLLSWEDNTSPTAENSLALVTTGEPQLNSPVSQQNNDPFSDIFPQDNVAANSLDPQSTYPAGAGQAFPSTPQLQYEQNLHSPHAALYTDGSASNMGSPHYQQQLHHEHLADGTQGSSYFPPPPWEAQPTENQQPMHPHYPQEMQMTHSQVSPHSQPTDNNNIHSHPYGNNHQVVGMYVQQQPIPTEQLASPVHNQMIHSQVSPHSQPTDNNNIHSHAFGSNHQVIGMYVQQQPIPSGQLASSVHNQPIQNNQLVAMHYQSLQGGNDMYYHQSMQGNQFPGYGSHPQYLEQRMYGLSIGNDSAASHSPYQVSATSSYVPPRRTQSKPEDKLFGDLLSMAKSKPKSPSVGTPGSTS